MKSRSRAKALAGALLGLCACSGDAAAAERVVWLEAEGFDTAGGWSNDSQFVDVMGSPCLLATGVGRPVADAVTAAAVPEAGEYRLWVRCRDWLPSHSPGQFRVAVGGIASEVPFGKSATNAWQWVDGGAFKLAAGKAEVRLRDSTGWWGRCDAVVLAKGDFRPSDEAAELARQRQRYGGVSAEVKPAGAFDLVVVGGGPAGLGAALAAARHGCRVALVQDRPVLGGNASSEIQVPPMGYIGKPPDTVNVSGLAEELFPPQHWANFADSKKLEAVVRAETNIVLFLNTRATGVAMADATRIRAVLALDVRSGQRLSFEAPLFADCTGHGWIGCYAGAEWRMGAEGREAFGESLAPEKASAATMGNSLYRAEIAARDAPVPFESPAWAYRWERDADFEPRGSHVRTDAIVRPENMDRPSRGKGRNPGNDVNGGVSHNWCIEYGGVRDTIREAEEIRDELFRISVGLWDYAKNRNPATVAKNVNRELVWLNYVQGVRESRRLVGDYVLSQRDYDNPAPQPDVVAFTDWGPDVHHPEGFWVRGNDAIHVYKGRRVGIPYRTLYSKNIANLFMAGRCHSATQTAFGGTRVMRPMCATGQAAGTAAALALRHRTTPRGVSRSHLEELQQALLRDGCYLPGVPNRDPEDLALAARAEASSEAKNAGAAGVNDGWSRKTSEGRSAWTPDPKAKGPAWVSLRLARTSAVREVHVTFEAKSAACEVQLLSDGSWKTAAALATGMPRRVVVPVSAVPAEAVRLLFVQPGAAAPAVSEIRVYGSPAAAAQAEPKMPAGVERVIFVKRFTYTSNHYYTEFINSAWLPGGNLCVLDVKSGAVRDLAPELAGGVFERYDVSFSAQKVAFAWKKSPQDGYRIYEVGTDGAGLRQLTFPQPDEAALERAYRVAPGYHHGTDDLCPCYLPDGGIAFVSTRCQYGILCDPPDNFTTTVLYRMDADGKNLTRLSNSSVSETGPSLLPDGRLLYTRWEYVDKGAVSVKGLWAVRPDGTASSEVYGNDIALPPTLNFGRAIPGVEQGYVVMGVPHCPQNNVGAVIRLDLSKPIRTREPMTYMTPDVDIRREGGFDFKGKDGAWAHDPEGKGPLFADAYPLSTSLFLVAHKPAGAAWSDAKGYGLYLLDAQGAVREFYRDPSISCWRPMPLRARQVPPVLSSPVNSELAERREAACMVADVYHGLEGVPRGAVKWLRVLEQVPRPWAAQRQDNRDEYDQQHIVISKDAHLGLKVQHGVVPVEADGSAHFVVPADANVFLQALDASFLSVQTERTFVNYRPGEVRACIGCHETPESAMAQGGKAREDRLAFRRAPSRPAPQPGEACGQRALHYPSDVQPLFDARCVSCHGAGEKLAGGLDLRGAPTRKFCVSYEALVPERRKGKENRDRGLLGLVVGENHPKTGNVEYLPALSLGARTSVLAAMLSRGQIVLAEPAQRARAEKLAKGHAETVARVTDEEFLRLANWIDTNCQYYGSYWGRRDLSLAGSPDFRRAPTFEEARGARAPAWVAR